MVGVPPTTNLARRGPRTVDTRSIPTIGSPLPGADCGSPGLRREVVASGGTGPCMIPCTHLIFCTWPTARPAPCGKTRWTGLPSVTASPAEEVYPSHAVAGLRPSHRADRRSPNSQETFGQSLRRGPRPAPSACTASAGLSWARRGARRVLHIGSGRPRPAGRAVPTAAPLDSRRVCRRPLNMGCKGTLESHDFHGRQVGPDATPDSLSESQTRAETRRR